MLGMHDKRPSHPQMTCPGRGVAKTLVYRKGRFQSGAKLATEGGAWPTGNTSCVVIFSFLS